MHMSNFTKNTTWKEQIISLFRNPFRKRLIAIKTYWPLRCAAMYSCRKVPIFQRNLLLHLLFHRWRQQVAPECLYPCIRLHNVTSQKTEIFIITSVRTSV
jgi:hypothetical protein